MSPHPEELLQIYIILGPFASSQGETDENPVILQDSLSGKAAHIEMLYLRRISLTESAYMENQAVLRSSPGFGDGGCAAIMRPTNRIQLLVPRLFY
ncbi:MAG: hypothetical protein E6230_03445 [Paenibacillus dendritiformis]|uniref:hypothetical protein n=1 Tax=uncultured Paenibacillus sp. TaxID=227322 RepID=UPI0025D69293|nr:hypothetical protein [uncultured Paenibacillus sp.]MDU5141225.1 hypothetical protein [Paenibacillus dendritiformis]